MDTSYVPNNPQFGLQLECNWSSAPNSNSQIYPPSQSASAASTHDDLSTCWSVEDNMGTFSLPLDLEPLPNLFPFSPCQNQSNYKTEIQMCPTNNNKLQPSADMADVLLSLKHAVIHPGQNDNFNATPPTQQQSSHLYHPQVILSPNGYTTNFESNFLPQPPSQPSIFPSMSVNVSMNMTMHHGFNPNASYPGTNELGTHQWNTPQITTPNTIYHQNPNLLSPSYGMNGGTTYSFTADFRTPPTDGVGSSITNANTTGAIYKRRLSDEQKPNVCRICGKCYARPSTLKTHLRTHSGEKPYRCLDCNKSFSQAANLTAHVRTHSGEKPFRCPVCERKFSQSSSVTTHMRTHSGERPYRCKLCKKAFSDSSTLTKHLRIHSGEKPYECKLCLLRFSQSGNLNRHMRVHGGGGMGMMIPP